MRAGHFLQRLGGILPFLQVLSLMFISLAAYSQSISLQASVAHNDKLQKEYSPYKRAVEERLGREFFDSHRPYAERRRVCEWDKVWIECGYFVISGASRLTAREREIVLEVVLDPCRFSVANAPRNAQPALDRETALIHFRELCRSHAFSATATRAAQSSRFADMKVKIDSQDSLAIETRIQERRQSDIRRVNSNLRMEQ